MNINSAFRPETRFSINQKRQIQHFVTKKTIEEPKCRALVFFGGVCFSFHGNLRVFFVFEKEMMSIKRWVTSV